MNFKFPISTKRIIQGEHLETISVEESVYRHLHLILNTQMGAYRFTPNYGCSLWQDDFSVGVMATSWSQDMTTRISLEVSNCEPRINKNFKIDIDTIKQEEDKDLNMKKQFVVLISNLILLDTNEAIGDMEYSFVFNPLTVR